MKKLLIIFLSTFCFEIYTQENEISVKSTLKEVTVFLEQASLKHITSKFNIPKGQQTLIIENIATTVIPQTIQLSGKGDFIILSSQFKKNYIQSKTISKEVKHLKDSMEIIQNKKNTLDIQVLSYTNEEELLLSNKSIGGANTGVSSAELEKIANFYRNRLNEIRLKKSELLLKITKYQEQITKIKNQLNELNSKENIPVGEIVVSVYANSNVNNASLEIEYICRNASWYPEYEIRVNDLKQPAQLHLKAQVIQNTGIDWNDVKLSLSSSSPNLNHNRPVLTPWWLSFMINTETTKRPAYKHAAPASANEAEYDKDKVFAKEKESIAESVSDYTNFHEKLTSQEYQIQIPVTITSNNKPSRIDVQTQSITTVRYIYYAVPKLNEIAYLIAEITEWEKYNLLNAPLYIFIENTYIGQSEINPDYTKDTLQVSLGQDKNISVKRQIIKKYNEKKLIGMYRKENRGYEIVVKNKKGNDINIIIEDQIPLSPVQEIEVELLESKDAFFDKVTGKLEWRLNIVQNEEKKVQFRYSVKYPKDKIIANL